MWLEIAQNNACNFDDITHMEVCEDKPCIFFYTKNHNLIVANYDSRIEAIKAYKSLLYQLINKEVVK